ncbi:hypothetical protein [Nocardia asteroides]|uniref:hypothetical protein n=1 Tax=Nocardia asteroides TaxID=1824 RepID=UPI0033C51C8E
MSVPIGWARFHVAFDVPLPDGYEGANSLIQFYCHAPMLPRAGEELDIDGPGDGLILQVESVEHSYRPPETSLHPHYETLVWTTLRDTADIATAQQMLPHPDEMLQWIRRHPLLEPVEKRDRDITCEECLAAGLPGRADVRVIPRHAWGLS